MPFVPVSCTCCGGDSGITTALSCLIDSVTVCPGDDPIVVDQGTTPWVVSEIITVTGGDFEPVAGSRWAETGADDLSLVGTTDLILQSPVPAVDQVVVIDSLSYFIEIAVGAALTTVEVTIREVDTPANVLWQGSVGFTASAGVGSTNVHAESDIYVFGAAGEQLEYVISLQAGTGVTASVSSNVGGFLATP